MKWSKISAETIRSMKGRPEKIAALTAYDYPMTKFLDELGIPLLLVGDSLGMVVLGYPDTTFVTLAEMEHHVRAAARAKPRGLLVADLPYRTYEDSEAAVRSASRLVAAGAEAVKAEGGTAIEPQVRAILKAGIPFLGHIGMLPQRVREEKGYHLKGKEAAEQDALLADARGLEQAGVFAVVLELVAPSAAREITRSVKIPTIGIGSGPDCDGQILVTPDLVGTSPGYIPRHVKPRYNIIELMRSAIEDWREGLEAAHS